jgi:hypothetical protein
MKGYLDTEQCGRVFEYRFVKNVFYSEKANQMKKVRLESVIWTTLRVGVNNMVKWRGATKHSSTRPRFSTQNLMIVFNVGIQIANKLGNKKTVNNGGCASASL